MGNDNPEFAIIKVYVNGNGKVVKVVDSADNNLKDEHYDPEEKRRIERDARLLTVNYCCWRLVRGRWKCVPC